jgi:hypothetical protein
MKRRAWPQKQAQDAKANQAQDASLPAAATAKPEQATAGAALNKPQQSAARPAAPVKSNPPAPASASAPAKTTAPPVPAAAPNAPLTKEQRLNDLNRRYRNDELSPVQYQTERAKIMAEP